MYGRGSGGTERLVNFSKVSWLYVTEWSPEPRSDRSWSLYLNHYTHFLLSLVNDLQSLPGATCWAYKCAEGACVLPSWSSEPSERHRAATRQPWECDYQCHDTGSTGGHGSTQKGPWTQTREPGMPSRRRWHRCSLEGEGESARWAWVGGHSLRRKGLEARTIYSTNTHSVTMRMFSFFSWCEYSSR